MFQSLILGNVVVSAMIMKSDQAKKYKKKINNFKNQCQTCGFSRVCGNAYKFLLHGLNDAEIYSMTNSNNYIE